MISLFVSFDFKIVTDFDSTVNNVIRNISGFKTAFYKGVTFCASGYCLGIVTLLLLILFKDKLKASLVVINLCISAIINNFILKSIFHRDRPSYMMINESGYSFPSGHSFVALAFYGLLIYFIYESGFSKNIKIVSISFLSLLIVMIGISRIYLGVHYPSDVLAGFIGGAIYLILFIEIVNVLKGVGYEKKKR